MQLIICELDGTLLNNSSKISDYNLEMINKWRQLGNEFTIATSRSYKSIYPYAKQLKLSEKAILNSGGVLYDFNKNVPLIAELLDKAAVKKTIKIIDKTHLNIVPIIDKIHTVCVPKNKIDILKDFVTPDELRYTKPISNFKKISYNGIAKLTLVGNKEEIKKVKKYVNSYWRFLIYKENYIEIIPRNANILAHLAMYTNKYNKIIAIGNDSKNMALFKAADITVCDQKICSGVKENPSIVLDNESVVGDCINTLLTASP